MTTKLPVILEELRIATPCSASWDDMLGDDRVRFCGRCEKNVYDLSALSRFDAVALVEKHEQRMCVRLARRADGTVITNDCPVGVHRQKLRQRLWSRVAGATASAALLLGLITGRARADLTVSDGKQSTAKPSPPPVMMGGAIAPTPVKPSPPVPMTGEVAPPPVKLMGKMVAPTPPPAPPKPAKKAVKVITQGEPMLMGDIAAPTPPAPTTTK
jgi:hypothetical protein